jgi:hypothetical protein
MLTIEILKQQYGYFYKKVLKNKPSFTDKNEKELSSFVKLLENKYGESIGEEWLFEYLCFQFNKFSSAETNMKIQTNWIYGKKALKNYQDRHEEADYFAKEFRHDYNIKRGHVFSDSEISISKHYKDSEKVRFKDKYRKLLHCAELDLYDDKSAICMFCEVRDKCYAKRKV